MLMMPQCSVFVGLLFAVGGYDGASRQCLSSVECYNPMTDMWTPVAEMSCRRSGAGRYLDIKLRIFSHLTHYMILHDISFYRVLRKQVLFILCNL